LVVVGSLEPGFLKEPQAMRRRDCLSLASCVVPAVARADAFDGDPHQSYAWPEIKREFLFDGKVEFDPRVIVQGPSFAEDPMNVPISVNAKALGAVERIVVVVDRNPIRKVLEYQPLSALPAIAFRFKLEQGSAVRAAARTKDGVWHVGSTWVDSSGGGCTVSGATRKDGSWPQTLGQGSARLYTGQAESPARLRLRVMHPMDTGLVGGVPSFYVNRLAVRDAKGQELARLFTWEPVSENPVFSFDFASPPPGPVSVVGSDNNGNRFSLRTNDE
jgi:sulfur-oxidizing protein SoxY